MNVLIVQPPDIEPAVEEFGTSVLTADVFSAPWDLLCLHSFLLQRSRHTCRFMDGRLSSDLESDLRAHLESISTPRVLVANTTSLNIGPVAAVLEITKRLFPDTLTVIAGQHPSQFPELAVKMPRIDYVLSGDPEPILRNLLDCIDIPPRLQLVPGLLFPGHEQVEPYWLNDLRSLVPGDWNGALWSGYELGIASRTCRAEMRLSRGNGQTAADRHFGRAYEPFRSWPLDKMAAKVMQAGHHGISEVFIQDSPGVWTWERLNHWLEALNRVRNSQAWGMRLLPAALDEDTVARLAHTRCRRIQLIYPSCDPNLLADHGCYASVAETRTTIALCKRYGIAAQLKLWVGGPEETEGEQERIVKVVRSLDADGFSLHGFPYRFDTPDYEKLARLYRAPQLDEWLQWAREPWLERRPVALWGGADRVAPIERTMQKVSRALRRDPRRIFRRASERLRGLDLSQATGKGSIFFQGNRKRS